MNVEGTAYKNAPRPRPAARINCPFWVGTGGCSYTHWTEAGFYPPETKPGRMLSIYARKFPIVELSTTWHQLPKAEAIERQVRQAPPGFLFTTKLTRSLTHEPLADDWRGQVEAFRQGLAPLLQTGQLCAVLIELPRNFDRSITNRRHLANLLDGLEGLPLAVEFRQGSWNNLRVFNELAKRGITLVSVDEPDLSGLFPALDVVTNPELLYIRFHGRNARGWKTGHKQLQYDYNYWESELREWIESRISRMAEKAKRGVVFFTNHVRAQAPQNAEILLRLLNEYGLVLGKL